MTPWWAESVRQRSRSRGIQLPAAGSGTLVIHGDSDAIVPFEASGKRSHDAIPGSELVLIKDGPHGINASHAQQFNDALLGFLGR